MRTVDELFARTLAGEYDGADDGAQVNDLLREFHRGYPVERLRDLLHSDNPRVVGNGAWILSELGGAAGALTDELPRLLSNPDSAVRYSAVDAALSCARDDAGIAEIIIRLLNDPTRGVRAVAAHFVLLLSPTCAATVLKSFLSTPDDEPFRRGVALLNESAPAADSLLNDTSEILRRFGAIIAVRRAEQDEGELTRALSSDDSSVRWIAESLSKKRDILARVRRTW